MKQSQGAVVRSYLVDVVATRTTFKVERSARELVVTWVRDLYS